MKKVFLPGMVAALSLGLGVNSVWAQGGVYGSGLSGSAFPVQSSGQFGRPSFQPVSTGIGTGVQQRFAQQNPAFAPTDHVHVPPGNYNVIDGTDASSFQASPLPSPTVPASGTVQQHVPQYAPQYAPVPQPQYQESPVGVDAGYGMPASAGCSTCGPSYSSVPSFSSYGHGGGFAPMHGGGATCAAPTQTVLSVVSPKPWIFGANALLFSRIDDEHVRFASDSNMPSRSLLTTRDVDFGHAGGFELFGGRYFGCGRYAVVASYWSLFPESQMARVEQAAGVNHRTNLPFTTRSMVDPNVYYGIELPTSNMYARYDGTFSQRLRRDQDFQNFELNFFSFALGGAARAGVAAVPVAGCGDCGGGGYGDCGGGGCGDCGSCASYGSCGQPSVAGSCLRGPTGPCAPIYGARCSKLRLSTLAGFRWFRFDDDLEYAASMTDNVYGSGADDVYYRNNVTNDLYGFQLGGIANYCTGKRFSFLAGARAGVFGNHITHDSYAGRNDMPATVMSPNSFQGQNYSFSSRDNDIAFIGEGNLGVGVCIARGWTANIGYRIIGVGGIATAPGQIPRDFGLMNDAMHINRNSSLLLHGITLGGAYNW